LQVKTFRQLLYKCMTTLSARWLLRRIFQSDICIRTTISKSGWRTVKQIILRTNCFQSGFRSRRFLGGVGVEFLTVLGVGVGFFCPTPDVQLGHFLHHTHKLGISVEMAEFLLKLLLKQRFLAVHHDFHCFDFNIQVPFMLRSRKFNLRRRNPAFNDRSMCSKLETGMSDRFASKFKIDTDSNSILRF